MKRFVIIAICVTVLHGFLAMGFTSLATHRAEREAFEGKLPGHAVFQTMGLTARILFYPLIWLRGEVMEPRTTLLFIANSLLWGVTVAVVCILVARYRARRQLATRAT
jgi:hypothetical protein